MSFIEKQRHGNGFYCYLVKNVRLSPSKVKKVRIFLGKEVPPHDKLQELFKEIEKKAPKPYSSKWLPKETLEQVEDLHASVAVFKSFPNEVVPTDFLVRFTYNTNAIEGNPLTLRQTALILSDNIAPQGARTGDVVEVMNGKDAWEFVKNCKSSVNEKFLQNVQYEVTKNTKCRLQGEYRDSEVLIGGSEWKPPHAKEVPVRMKKMVAEYRKLKRKLHPVELATWVHNNIVQIHPFTDGNGRTARLLMNWTLIRKKFPPVVISVQNKEQYYYAIEAADRGDQKPFAVFLAKQLLAQYFELEKKSRDRQQTVREQ
ncbi:Fic family protein [Candidatus Micrarchaeota archaeon]|nr:Fic family protein [Candidatus Micrarchaeota archaeon]